MIKDFLAAINGFRKLLVCLFVVFVATGFVIAGTITSDDYTKIMTITVPAYFAGNIGEHLTKTVKDYVAGKFKGNG